MTSIPLNSSEINSASYEHKHFICRLKNISVERSLVSAASPASDYVIHHADIHMSSLIIKFPRWQRCDRWSNAYEQDLIKSVLTGKGIPMLFIAHYTEEPINFLSDYPPEQDVSTEADWIIDGGHRTRAFCRFKNNEFSIQIISDGNPETVYYDSTPKGHHHSRKLTPREKEQFDNYKITATHYTNMSEKQAREKFNVLNHSRPMTLSEQLNSIQRPVVDFLRTEGYRQYPNGQNLLMKLTKMRGSSFKKINNHEYMSSLYSVFSIVNPRGTTPDGHKKLALEHCKLSSGELEYIKDHYYERISQGEVDRFREAVDNIILVDQNINSNISTKAFMYSAIYHMQYNSMDGLAFIEMTDTFVENQVTWKGLHSQIENLIKNQSFNNPVGDLVNELQAVQKHLDPHDYYKRWLQTQKSGGTDKKGMIGRRAIFEEVMRNQHTLDNTGA